MLQSPRQRNSFKKKIGVYISLLIVLGFLFFLANLFFQTKSSSFISPLGTSNVDKSKVEKILKDNNIAFSGIVVLEDASYGISIPNNGQVRLSSQKNINKQVASLQRILRELTIEGKPFKNIDFRFEEPIISY
ncbi:MAG: hypothetical protein HYW62_02615 [Candidatus Levybacteria bacterium]|nr:hypothetical protein [Candidatus Levybacteria bacterium]